jgi:hypothetical protein
MKRSRNPLILMLALFLLLGSLPAAADERPFGLSGAGNLAFTGGNPPAGADLTASGVATHLGLWTAVGVLSFSPGPEPHLILANGTQTFTAANGDKLDATFTDAVLDTHTGIATGVFVFDGQGGTGRFEGAIGSAPFVVMQDLETGDFEVTAIGTIDF